ncbi:hypothetical protein OIDMADRAFT_21077 [Oidiodendron maius Zn]|uniref:Uncharacterized protein n=1 Tax=Oidiodendron maius (strain Zn) TaxID=913774 RepID=A0A0C3GGB0_OIDMZ|nr:hypothetical protein OIDMADRAFT_21077 [Oidiodendron maius Zn]
MPRIPPFQSILAINELPMSLYWVVNPLSLFLTHIPHPQRVNLSFLFLPDTHKVASLNRRAQADSSKALLWYIGVYRKRPARKEPLNTAGRGDMVHMWVDLGR